MYISQTFNILHDWWRYLLGSVITFFSWQVIGAIPLVIVLMIRIMGADEGTFPSDIPQMIEILGSNMFLFLMLLSFAVGFIGLLMSTKFIHKQSFRSLTTARSKIDWKRFWFAFLFWGILSSGLMFLDYYMEPETYQWNFQADKFIILAALAIIMIPIQTSFEEYFFRGYLMQGLGVVLGNKWAPLLITSVGFGLLHIFNPEVDQLGYIIMVYYIGTGLFLGIITLMDDGLELALGFHAANNLFTALLVTADWTAIQTDSIFKDMSNPTEAGILDIVVPVFVLFPILIFIFGKVYKWRNWKEKLLGPVTEPPAEDYKLLGEE